MLADLTADSRHQEFRLTWLESIRHMKNATANPQIAGKFHAYCFLSFDLGFP